jgi:RNase adaptor protein for sRNA GlmZ degradation
LIFLDQQIELFVNKHANIFTANLKDVLSLTSNVKAREAIEAQIKRNESQILLTNKRKELLVQRLTEQIRKHELLEQQQQQVRTATARMSKVSLF